jgi:chromosome segregation ATPase
VAFVGGGGSASALAKFDAMIEKAEITPELFEKLGQGLMSLNKTTSQLAEISEAGLATKEFVSKVKTATESVSVLGETYQKSSEVLKESVNSLSESYINSAQSFNQTNNQISEAYSQFATKLTNEIATVGNLGSVYTDKLGALNGNLATLNSVYELQIQNMNQQADSSKAYANGLNQMVANINETVEHTKKLNDSVQQLEQNITSLNNIYGNMLSSINIK